MKKPPLDLAGGLRPEEVKALMRIRRDLEEDGYEVLKVAHLAEGKPAALVAQKRTVEPVIKILVAARSVLRHAERLEVAPVVTPEEYETLQALRTTAFRLAKNAEVEGPRTLGDVAHVDFARQAQRGADLED